MARKSDVLSVSGSDETIIGTGVSAKGTLTSETDILIDGNFAGDIKAAGNVTLGVNAVVKADIVASNVTVAGHLDGNVTAEGETNLAESGHIKGNITTALLSIATGAIFIGTSKMTGAGSALPHPSNAEVETEAKE